MMKLKEKNLISIIIPIYNGEKYIDALADRLINQSYKNLEFIFINDGSQDNSYELCEKYCYIDERFKLYTQNNKGLCAARNLGIEKSNGEWLSFIDQDDVIDLDTYLHFSKNTETADIIVSGKEMLLLGKSGNLISKKTYIYEKKILKKEQYIPLLFNSNSQGMFQNIWNCLYRKEIIEKNNITFDTKLRKGQEDTLFNICYVLNCNSAQFLPYCDYHYYRRTCGSTSMQVNENYIEDFEEITKVVNLQIVNKNYNLDDYWYTFKLRLGINLFCEYGRNKKNNYQKKDIKRIYENINKNGNNIIKKYTIESFRKYCVWFLIDYLLEYNCINIVILILKFIKNDYGN